MIIDSIAKRFGMKATARVSLEKDNILLSRSAFEAQLRKNPVPIIYGRDIVKDLDDQLHMIMMWDLDVQRSYNSIEDVVELMSTMFNNGKRPNTHLIIEELKDSAIITMLPNFNAFMDNAYKVYQRNEEFEAVVNSDAKDTYGLEDALDELRDSKGRA
jgi:hypothetical protein